jgi:hypothetical protein
MGLLQRTAQQEQPAPQQPVRLLNAKQQMLPRVLAAAQKLMYSEKTRPMFLKMLDVEGDNLDKASAAAVKVILTIVDETKGKIDPTIVPPAGATVVGDILDFMENTENVKFSVDDTHKAVSMFLDKLQAAIKNGGDSMIQTPQMPQGAQ